MEVVEYSKVSSLMFPAVHAATMVEVDGVQAVTWFAGRREGDECVIRYKRELAGETTVVSPGWAPSRTGIKSRLSLWNPVLHWTGDRLLLWFKEGVFCDRWHTMVAEITIDGDIKRMASMPAGVMGPVKGPPVNIGNGMAACGASFETYKGWSAHIEVMRVDEWPPRLVGRSLPLEVDGSADGWIQPAVFDMGTPGLIGAFLRPRTTPRVGYVVYDAAQLEQIAGVSLDIPNPNSAIAATVSEDIVYMANNPVEEGRGVLALSAIDVGLSGVTEVERIIVANGSEVSYPALIPRSEGGVWMVHTKDRIAINRLGIEPFSM